MVKLVAQFVDVDLVGEPYGCVAVDERESGIDVAMHLPDHLEHQQLVEISVE